MPVTVHEWPTAVPDCIYPLSPQGGVKANRYSFETDSPAPPIERPIHTWAPEQYTVDLVPMSLSAFEVFQTWFRGTLGYGVSPFRFKHPITKEYKSWRFVNSDPPYQVTKSRLIPNDRPNRRAIKLTFSIMSMPYSFPADFLIQEGVDEILQEQSDKIIIRDGFSFTG